MPTKNATSVAFFVVPGFGMRFTVERLTVACTKVQPRPMAQTTSIKTEIITGWWSM